MRIRTLDASLKATADTTFIRDKSLSGFLTTEEKTTS